MSVWYGVEGDDERCECDWIKAESEHGESLAETCAEHYHDLHNGWEVSWPITLILYESETGPETGRYEVKRVDRPHFEAKRT